MSGHYNTQQMAAPSRTWQGIFHPSSAYPSTIPNNNPTPPSLTTNFGGVVYSQPRVPRDPLPDPWAQPDDFHRHGGLQRYVAALQPPMRVMSVGEEFEFPSICRMITFGNTDPAGWVQPVNLWIHGHGDIDAPNDPEVYDHINRNHPKFTFEIQWSTYPPWKIDLLRLVQQEYPDMQFLKQLTKHILLYVIAKAYRTYSEYYVYGINNTLNINPGSRSINYVSNENQFGLGGVDVFRMYLAFITMDGDQVWRARTGLVLAPRPTLQENTSSLYSVLGHHFHTQGWDEMRQAVHGTNTIWKPPFGTY
ncbi:hypothetical protein BDN70DRAFT_934953 [Pholiota conissans]|uniref:Uncharacterized protein n=1 Tax=Pholiota conissans TaxID=109636 RepID=A0A9P5YWN4_9AGAR|nr:hypothetical protein BDN70DRAFT_934953 [Pholiota conissans]